MIRSGEKRMKRDLPLRASVKLGMTINEDFKRSASKIIQIDSRYVSSQAADRSRFVNLPSSHCAMPMEENTNKNSDILDEAIVKGKDDQD